MKKELIMTRDLTEDGKIVLWAGGEPLLDGTCGMWVDTVGIGLILQITPGDFRTLFGAGTKLPRKGSITRGIKINLSVD
jgi:hypothetical protein